MTKMRQAVIFVLSLLLAPAAFGAYGPERLAGPRLEARAVALQRALRCVVCQGESLDESGAPLAADLRNLIRAKIEKGWTDTEIEKYLVARYGDFILMQPPLEPLTYALWFGPLIVLSIGGAAAAAVIFRARRNARAQEPG